MSEMSKPPTPYVRRRAFNKVHIKSWIIYLEKDGYVKCSFKDCNFMAQDVTEMGKHYGVCNGDNSWARFTCSFCGGCTVSKEKLQSHLVQAHKVSIPTPQPETKPLQNSEITHLQKIERIKGFESNSKPSRILQVTWECFFEQNNYVRCSDCSYLAMSLPDISRHHQVCKLEKKLLVYVCGVCRGRTINVNSLIWHLERCHQVYMLPQQFNHISKVMIQFWEKEIREQSYSSCLHLTKKGQRDCFYIDIDVMSILNHCQTCKGPDFHEKKVTCGHCEVWSESRLKLNYHKCTKLMDNRPLLNIVRDQPMNDVKLEELQPTYDVTHTLEDNSDRKEYIKHLVPKIEAGKLLVKTMVGTLENSSKSRNKKSVVKIKQEMCQSTIGYQTNSMKPPSCANSTEDIRIDSCSKYGKNSIGSDIPTNITKPEVQRLILKNENFKHEDSETIKVEDEFDTELKEECDTLWLEYDANDLKQESQVQIVDKMPGGQRKNVFEKCISLFEDEPSSDEDWVPSCSTFKPSRVVEESTEFVLTSFTRQSPRSYSRRPKKSEDSSYEFSRSLENGISSFNKNLSGLKKIEPSKISTNLNFESTSTMFENSVETDKDMLEKTSKSSEKSDKLIVAANLGLNKKSFKRINIHDKGIFINTASSQEGSNIKYLPSEERKHNERSDKSVRGDDQITNVVISNSFGSARLERPKLETSNNKVLFFFNKTGFKQFSNGESHKMPSIIKPKLEQSVKIDNLDISTKVKLQTSYGKDEAKTSSNPSGGMKDGTYPIANTETVFLPTHDYEDTDNVIYETRNTNETVDTINSVVKTENANNTVDDSNRPVAYHATDVTDDINHSLAENENTCRPMSDCGDTNDSLAKTENTNHSKAETENTNHLRDKTENTNHLRDKTKNTNHSMAETENTCLSDRGETNQSMAETENTCLPICECENTNDSLAEAENTNHFTAETENTCLPMSDFGETDYSMAETENTNHSRDKTENTNLLMAETENNCLPMSECENTNESLAETENTSHFTPNTENTCLPMSDFGDTDYLMAETENTCLSDRGETNRSLAETENTNHSRDRTENSNNSMAKTENTCLPMSDCGESNYLIAETEINNLMAETENTCLSDRGETNHSLAETENTNHSRDRTENSNNSMAKTENTCLPMSDCGETNYSIAETEINNLMAETENTCLSDRGETNHSLAETENTCLSDHGETNHSLAETENTNHSRDKTENINNSMAETENTCLSDRGETNHSLAETENTNHSRDKTENTNNSMAETENTCLSDRGETNHSLAETENTNHSRDKTENTNNSMAETENTCLSDRGETNHSLAETENTNHSRDKTENTNNSMAESENTNHSRDKTENSNNSMAETENTCLSDHGETNHSLAETENTNHSRDKTENSNNSMAETENTCLSDHGETNHSLAETENTNHSRDKTENSNNSMAKTENTCLPVSDCGETNYSIAETEINNLMAETENTCLSDSGDNLLSKTCAKNSKPTKIALQENILNNIHSNSMKLSSKIKNSHILILDSKDSPQSLNSLESINPIVKANSLEKSSAKRKQGKPKKKVLLTSKDCVQDIEIANCDKSVKKKELRGKRRKSEEPAVKLSQTNKITTNSKTFEMPIENSSSFPELESDFTNICTEEVNENLMNQFVVGRKDDSASFSEIEIPVNESFEDRSMSPVLFDDTERVSSDEETVKDDGSQHVKVQEDKHSRNEVDFELLPANVMNSVEKINLREELEYPSRSLAFKTGLIPEIETQISESLSSKTQDHNLNAEALDYIDSCTANCETSVAKPIIEISFTNVNTELKDGTTARHVEEIHISLFSDEIEEMFNLSNSSLKNSTQNQNFNSRQRIDSTLDKNASSHYVNPLDTFGTNNKSTDRTTQQYKGEEGKSEMKESNKLELSERPSTAHLNVKKRGRPKKKQNEENDSTQLSNIGSELGQICGGYTESACKETEAENISDTEMVSSESIKKSIFTPPAGQAKKRGRPSKKTLTPQQTNEAFTSSQKDSGENISGTSRKENASILPAFDDTILCISTDMPAVTPNELISKHLTKPAKKRGRPPKRKCEFDTSTQLCSDEYGLEQSVSTESLNSISQKTKIVSSDFQPCDNVSTTSNKEEMSISIPEKSVLTPMKKRGRPPKQKSGTEEMDKTVSNEEIKEKKCSILVNKEPPEENLQTPPSQQIKKRGRPKKLKCESQLSTEISTTSRIIKIDNICNSSPEISGLEKSKEDIFTLHDDNDDDIPLISRIDDQHSKKKGQKRKNSIVDGNEDLHSTKKIKSDLEENPQHKKPTPPRHKQPRKHLIKKRESAFNDEIDCGDRIVKTLSPKQKSMARFMAIYFVTDHKPSDEVVCGVCKLKMMYQSYKKHAIYIHYMLSWIDGETPVDMKDSKDVVNRLWFAKKNLGKLPFKCHLCKTSKLSAVGFQSHIQFCGVKEEEKESLLWTCNICGSKMMPSSQRNHFYLQHKSETPDLVEADCSLIIPRARRAAANRAEEVIQANQQDLEVGPQSPSSTNEMGGDLKLMYFRPPKMAPKDIRDKWVTSLEESGRASCPNEGCDFNSDVLLFLRRHYFSGCKSTPIKINTYRCKFCEFYCKEESDIQSHVSSNHQDKLAALEESCPESSDDSGSDSNHHRLSAHRGFFDPNQTNPFKFLKNTKKTGGRKWRRGGKPFVFSESYRWTLEMREENLTPETLLYKDLQPSTNSLQPLPPHKAALYLPPLQSSAQFCGSNGPYRTLSRFQSTLVDGVPVMFAGGPVWTAAWAPVPDSEKRQFLALATLPNTELLHQISSVYSYKSLIQIWSFDQLSNTEECAEAPKFMLGLGHGRGAVWKLQWCPSGCYQGVRLGLLAAACSDGTVAIYSIPQHCPSQSTIHVASPVLELKLGCEMLSQCTSLDWHSVSPHNLVAGGFANGLVALWDLTTTSPLLRVGKTIFPFKVVEAHHSSVSAINLSPTLEEDCYMMTASLDRCTKFWQLGDLTAPVNVIRKAGVLDATMPSHWLTSISGYDDVYSLNNSHITGYSYRETFWTNNNNFMLQVGSIWSVAFNDWINSCACASEMGKISLFFRQQILVQEEHKKIQKHSKNGDIITCSIVHLNEEITDKVYGSYSDCNSKLGLKFSFNNHSLELKKGDTGGTFDMYPLLSFNHVSWNQNEKSFLWLCAGMQSGLVLTPRLSFLSDNVSKWTSS